MPKSKAAKDPNKPKGRTSAYAFFVQERRDYYRKTGQAVDFTLFSKECAEKWKKVDKDVYQQKAEADKKRYDNEMAEYQPPVDTPGKKGKKRKSQDKTKPKRALSGFLYFSSEKRPQLKAKNPGASVGDLAKMLGSDWKTMSEEDKKPFNEKAKGDRERYDREMELWKKGEFVRSDEAEDVEDSDEEED